MRTKLARALALIAETAEGRWRIAWLRIRFPNMRIDHQTRIGRGCRITCADDSRLVLAGAVLSDSVMLQADNGGELIIDRSFIGRHSVIAARASVRIGPGCLLGEAVTVRDQDHTSNGFVTAPVRICARAWIGAKASVLRGVTVHDDAVVGAHALVRDDVPSNAVAVGVPARSHQRR